MRGRRDATMNSSTPSRGTQRYRMTVAYDGTAYAGWQVQPNQQTIQGEMERVLHELTGTSTRIHSSGRTDQGVHARGQVVHFDLERTEPARQLLRGFNALLPEDIRVLCVRRVASDFHARSDAREKEYRYFIWNEPVMPPWLRQYRTLVRMPLNVAAMNRAARQLVGQHDFAAFSANPQYEREGTVRHLRALRVRQKGAEIEIVARGDGFLYRMVRSLAGFLIRVGTGELPPEAAGEILASKTRTARVPTAPGRGLFLWRVTYGSASARRPL